MDSSKITNSLLNCIFNLNFFITICVGACKYKQGKNINLFNALKHKTYVVPVIHTVMGKC